MCPRDLILLTCLKQVFPNFKNICSTKPHLIGHSHIFRHCMAQIFIKSEINTSSPPSASQCSSLRRSRHSRAGCGLNAKLRFLRDCHYLSAKMARTSTAARAARASSSEGQQQRRPAAAMTRATMPRRSVFWSTTGEIRQTRSPLQQHHRSTRAGRKRKFMRRKRTSASR